jgi:hypothetical protein
MSAYLWLPLVPMTLVGTCRHPLLSLDSYCLQIPALCQYSRDQTDTEISIQSNSPVPVILPCDMFSGALWWPAYISCPREAAQQTWEISHGFACVHAPKLLPSSKTCPESLHVSKKSFSGVFCAQRQVYKSHVSLAFPCRSICSLA